MQSHSSNDNFYRDLAGFKHFSDFTRSKWYTALPSDWLVVITDVQGSTQAIQEGQYKQVNALGAASIVALLNSVKPIVIPYVFGGDGATLCIPPSKIQAVASALIATKHMAMERFNLKLRIGMVPKSVIVHNGHSIHIGKYQPVSHYSLSSGACQGGQCALQSQQLRL